MRTKKVAILQSNYIPWKGYFDIISSVDEFIFYDEVQYTKNDWRNRNLIKTNNGLQWLSIPVMTKGHLTNSTKICDATIKDSSWAKKHWQTIYQFYRKAPYFNKYSEVFAELYDLAEKEEKLCRVNYLFIQQILKILNINTKISFSQDYGLIQGKTERLVDLVTKANGNEYLSGPAAKSYIDKSLFDKANITLSWINYEGYKEYPQLYPPFKHQVSIIDLIFNCGPNSSLYLKSHK